MHICVCVREYSNNHVKLSMYSTTVAGLSARDELCNEDWGGTRSPEHRERWTKAGTQLSSWGHGMPCTANYKHKRPSLDFIKQLWYITRIKLMLAFSTREYDDGGKHVKEKKQTVQERGSSVTASPEQGHHDFLTCRCEAQWNGACNYQENLAPARWTSEQRTIGRGDEILFWNASLLIQSFGIWVMFAVVY